MIMIFLHFKYQIKGNSTNVLQLVYIVRVKPLLFKISFYQITGPTGQIPMDRQDKYRWTDRIIANEKVSAYYVFCILYIF